MRARLISKLAFIAAICGLVIWPKFSISAGLIEGLVKDEGGHAIKKAVVMLHNITEKTDDPKIELTDEGGKFYFNVDKDFCQYLLAVYANGEMSEAPIDYRGQKTDFEISLGKKWYQTEWFRNVLTFFSFLGSFLLGLFSREVEGWRKRRKVQKSIASIYQSSVNDFLQEFHKTKDLERYEERIYRAIYSKSNLIKDNLKALLSYSWAVERMDPILFDKILKKMSAISALEGTLRLEKEGDWKAKLVFLKNHHDNDEWPGRKAEHENFETLLADLKEDIG